MTFALTPVNILYMGRVWVVRHGTDPPNIWGHPLTTPIKYLRKNL